MNRAQILVFGGEGALTDQLQELAQKRSVLVRTVRQTKSCLNLLRAGGGSILVLKLGANLEEELALVAEAKRLCPETTVLVVGTSDHPTLAGLCWDLGAAYVLLPPEPLDRLREIVAGFLP